MGIKVIAIAEGYYGNVLRTPGAANAEFEIASEDELGKWMKVIDGGTPAEPEADPFLDRSVAQIAGDLPTLTPEQLVRYWDAESKGKARKGVLEAIDAETAARSAGA